MIFESFQDQTLEITEDAIIVRRPKMKTAETIPLGDVALVAMAPPQFLRSGHLAIFKTGEMIRSDHLGATVINFDLQHMPIFAEAKKQIELRIA